MLNPPIGHRVSATCGLPNVTPDLMISIRGRVIALSSILLSCRRCCACVDEKNPAIPGPSDRCARSFWCVPCLSLRRPPVLNAHGFEYETRRPRHVVAYGRLQLPAVARSVWDNDTAPAIINQPVNILGVSVFYRRGGANQTALWIKSIHLVFAVTYLQTRPKKPKTARVQQFLTTLPTFISTHSDVTLSGSIRWNCGFAKKPSATSSPGGFFTHNSGFGPRKLIL